MKVPDSGLPEEAYWESLFDVPLVLERLGLDRSVKDVAELGCGYGTFTIPLARRVSGTVFAFDVEPRMIARTAARAAAAGIRNVKAELRDVLKDGFGLEPGSCSACLLFNMLHCPDPEAVLREAARIIIPGGHVLLIHWRSDIPTPRGPPLSIRPRPTQILQWGHAAGLKPGFTANLPPWHFGIGLGKLSSAHRPPHHMGRRAA